jgi:hypothetical protein
LVNPKKGNSRKWEVAWAWLPHFLAADLSLVSHVDKVLTEEFKGTELPPQDQLARGQDYVTYKMHHRVVDLIVEKYPIKGLRSYVQEILTVEPEERS